MFPFLIGESEVNVMLAEAYFTDIPQPSMLDFRKQLAKELIYNTYDDDDANGGKIKLKRSQRKIEAHTHELLS